MEKNDIEDMLRDIEKTVKDMEERKISKIMNQKSGEISDPDDIRAFHSIMNKTTVYDHERKKIFAFDDDLLVEISPKMINALAKALLKITEKCIEIFQKREYDYKEIEKVLIGYERYNAARLVHPDISKAKEEFYQFLRTEIEKGKKQKKIIDRATYHLFKESRENIPRGIRTFKNVEYKIRFEEEKELLRTYYIAELFREGIFDFNFLCNSGELEHLKPEFIDYNFRRTSIFTKEELVKAFIKTGKFKTKEDVLDYYYTEDKKSFFELANAEDLIQFVVKGKFDEKRSKKGSDRDTAIRKLRLADLANLSPEVLEQLLSIKDLPKNSFIDINKSGKFISRTLMMNVSREALLHILESKNIEYGNPLTSEDYIELYGKLSFNDIINLNEMSYIQSKDIIKLIKFTNLDEDNIKNGLMKFYDLDRIEELIKEGKINKKFLEDYTRFVNEILSEEERQQYKAKLAEEISLKDNKEEIAVLLVQTGIEFGEIKDLYISSEKIEDLFLEEKISEKDIIRLYIQGIVGLDIIESVFSTEDIVEKYKAGELDIFALGIIKDIKLIESEFLCGNISIQDVINLYAMEKGINLEELKTIIGEEKIYEIGLGELLPNTISAEKIEELFKNYYISHNELSDLVFRKLITAEEAERIAKELASHEEYESLFSGNGIAVLTRDTEEGENYGRMPLGSGHSRDNRLKNDPDLRVSLLEELGFDKRTIKLVGQTNSLNGYTVYLSEELGVMVFMNAEKPGNATYIMSLQQGMYFLQKTKRGYEVESDATKKELRKTEHVKVRNASKGWGENILHSISQINPEFRKTYSLYRKNVESIISEISGDYEKRK